MSDPQTDNWSKEDWDLVDKTVKDLGKPAKKTHIAISIAELQDIIAMLETAVEDQYPAPLRSLYPSFLLQYSKDMAIIALMRKKYNV